MADGSERRVARRFTMSLPLRVLPREARSNELRTQTRDVSYQGLYFLAEAQFEVGTEIEFVLTLPKQIAQSTEVDIRCRGQIARRCERRRPRGCRGEDRTLRVPSGPSFSRLILFRKTTFRAL